MRATLSAITGLDVTLDLTYTGTATGGGTDYTASGSQITIPAGSTTGSVTITGGDDDLIDEAAETVLVDVTEVSPMSQMPVHNRPLQSGMMMCPR